MKHSILIIAAAFSITGAFFSSCQSAEQKITNKQSDDSLVSKTLIYTVHVDTITTYHQFKVVSIEKISANEKTIAEIKQKIAGMKTDKRMQYEKAITELERKNNELKNNLENFKDEGQENWTIFKEEFNHDMNELGNALKNLVVENVD